MCVWGGGPRGKDPPPPPPAILRDPTTLKRGENVGRMRANAARFST